MPNKIVHTYDSETNDYIPVLYVDNGDGTYSLSTRLNTGEEEGEMSRVTLGGELVNVTLNDEHPQILFTDENGTPYGIKQVNNKPRVSSMPYLYDIAEGNIPGHSEFEMFGYNPDIDISAEDVWGNGGLYVFPTVAQQMELVSSSAEDDPDKGGAVAGTGIHTVTIYYLNNLYEAKTEDINLNGTGVVTTVATDIFRVNRIKAKVVGSSGVAVGTILLRHLSDSPVYSSIDIGNTRSRNSIYTVPLGKTLYITSLAGGCGAASSSTATITLHATYDHEAAALRTFFLPHAEVIIGSGTGGVVRHFEIPLKFPEKTNIKCRATTTANNSIVSVGVRGWLE
jgi:hypothetical protein